MILAVNYFCESVNHLFTIVLFLRHVSYQIHNCRQHWWPHMLHYPNPLLVLRLHGRIGTNQDNLLKHFVMFCLVLG